MDETFGIGKLSGMMILMHLLDALVFSSHFSL
jgi:hypothetical protein